MNIGIVAHDEMKDKLVDWVARHASVLAEHSLYATGTTGQRVMERCQQLQVQLLKSGPLGGDQQLGAMICEGKLDALIFFIDPLSPHPHDVDIKALIRLVTLYNTLHAYNESTADLIIDSLRDH